MGRKRKVLILSKELDFGGGVANFVSMLLANLPEYVEREHFRIGEPRSGKGGFRKLGWPLIDNVRLLRRLLKGDISCLHLNPSMNWNAFMRDALLLMTARTVRFNSFIVFFHGWDERFVEQIGKHSVYRFLLQRFYGRAGFIIVLAQRFKEQLVALGLSDDRIVVTTTMFEGSIFKGLEGGQKKGDEIQSKDRISFEVRKGERSFRTS